LLAPLDLIREVFHFGFTFGESRFDEANGIHTALSANTSRVRCRSTHT
jgi:hypothetical protein